MKTLPKDRNIDSTLSLLKEGYLFIPNRCKKYNSDIFQTKLRFEKYICITGAEAAKIFYDTEKFERNSAAPGRIKKTLFGRGGVQGLDGEEHKRRKNLFMSVMSDESINNLVEIFHSQLYAYGKKWESVNSVVLFDEVREILCRSVCKWAGVPLDEDEVKKRTAEFARMIEGPGSVGKKYVLGRIARIRGNIWIKQIIRDVRNKLLFVEEDKPLYIFAHHKNNNGEWLDVKTAAVEIINLLRPTVAIARFIDFAALALQNYPEYRNKIKENEEEYLEIFVQEVRRYYPFFPFAAAKVKNEFVWKGYQFPQGRKVLLDLYGTNHDEKIWNEPEKFYPERFIDWTGEPFTFIPQGGGDHYQNHRCAGEWITIEIMKSAVKFLVREINYDVPVQDLTVKLSQMPAIPKSRFIISNVNIQ